MADFFCGSGTTPAVAERLGRSWIAADQAPLAVNTTRRRLLLEQQRGGFEVWKSANAESASEVETRIAVKAEKLAVEAEILRPKIDQLTAVEFDWEYDGRLFRSVDFSVRNWREERLSSRLVHQYPKPGEYLIAARALDSTGQVGLTTERVILDSS